ncbi:hypothetical protein [Parafilimonas sp.]|uniref:hypothetical protein n=1 Tax=Parafilimonas sp. TaxID=1969739 RepID=UPI003F7D5488
MQFIQGNKRNQTCFSTLDDQVSIDNPVRLILLLICVRSAGYVADSSTSDEDSIQPCMRYYYPL